jgi:hypothetical protein
MIGVALSVGAILNGRVHKNVLVLLDDGFRREGLG